MSLKTVENLSEVKSTETSSNLLKRIQSYAFGNRHVVISEPEEVVETTVLLNQLRSNISKLEETSARLEFMLDEVSTLVKRR